VRAFERRLEILKSVGCNAIRTSHNPPAPELLDLCDRMGFVVIAEAFDKWDPPNGRWFSQWWREDLGDMLRRDRNHPCIVLWSVGNELSNQESPEFKQTLKTLVDFVHEQEPTRPVTCALRPRKIESREENAAAIASIAKFMDVLSCNYQEQWFEDYRRACPEMVIIASESYPYYRGNGDTHKAFYPVNPWLDAEKHDYVAGTFYWTGIDYLGEAVAGWPFHGWNCSLIDTCGFPRPVSCLHKSFWTDAPMVHIAVRDDGLDVPKPTKDHWGWPPMDSHWTLPFKEGKEVEVWTFSNCSAVELLINGKSLGTKKLKDFPDRIMKWKVPYQTGGIEARGIERERIVCSHQLRTAGEPANIRLIADRKDIRADGSDLCNIEVQVTDKRGVLVPASDHEIQFTIQGPGKIIGVDNGDLTSMEPYQADKRKTFHGRALVVVQSARNSGKITLRAQSTGLPAAKLGISVR
jgi:beta-galactosidase